MPSAFAVFKLMTNSNLVVVRYFGAAKDFSGVYTGLSKRLGEARPVARQPAGQNEVKAAMGCRHRRGDRKDAATI